ncbi:MAG: hypothetical protein AB7S70_01540 [Hyphomicrobium sp.]|uniref:hypothetical protein n=1 Tax=Hyphomicrobium sp. TaxID=82 RepID=UPI003D0D06B6
MNANRHDDAAARPASRPVPGPEPAAGTGLITRHRLVAGVFTNPLEAGSAIVTLAAGGAKDCALVLLSGGPDGRSSGSERAPGTNFAVHHIDASAPLAPRLAEILARETHDCAAAGMQRLIQRLAQHLSDGSAVVVCSTRAADQQRLVSQTFLEARCKVVLTHEDERGGCSSGPASDACCGACGSPCDREAGS